ncbi:OsmC family protein [Aquibacillus albus]|uniref:OsmC-like protein n=1 Tax=Aquibacillus albus TaxID=1168171 RepID=A0ABS2N2R4_9BACI|nr:OsmC family protein [Aquibacillus albus]MBM7572425.1 putative OsmC-like protein [Aquibacillus albus]
MRFYLKESGIRTSFPFGELDISGDEALGFRPFQLMVASIAGCSANVFRKILEKQRIEVEDITVEAEIDRNVDEANKIEKIHLHFIIKGKRLDDDKLYKNLEVSRKNCSMIRSVENSIEITETLETIEISA